MSKPNMIILFGSDGAGKTTIAQGLSQALGFPVEHHGPVKTYQEGYNEYFLSVRSTDYSVIKDRFYEGERIFAPLYRNYEASYFPELEKEIMKKFNSLLVLVHAPFNIILDRLNQRGEDFVKEEHFEYCFNKVIEVFNDSLLPKIMIDTHMKPPFENIKYITKKVIL